MSEEDVRDVDVEAPIVLPAQKSSWFTLKRETNVLSWLGTP
jgi:hypothetical protein